MFANNVTRNELKVIRQFFIANYDYTTCTVGVYHYSSMKYVINNANEVVFANLYCRLMNI